MPYSIKKGKGAKPYKIVNLATGQEVGSSDTPEKAARSIGYRMAGENAKKHQGMSRKVITKRDLPKGRKNTV